MHKCQYLFALQVTKVPMWEYADVGQEVHIGHVDDHPGIPLFTDIPDHDISKYIVNIVATTPQSQVHEFESAHAVELVKEFTG